MRKVPRFGRGSRRAWRTSNHRGGFNRHGWIGRCSWESSTPLRSRAWMRRAQRQPSPRKMHVFFLRACLISFPSSLHEAFLGAAFLWPHSAEVGAGTSLQSCFPPHRSRSDSGASIRYTEDLCPMLHGVGQDPSSTVVRDESVARALHPRILPRTIGTASCAIPRFHTSSCWFQFSVPVVPWILVRPSPPASIHATRLPFRPERTSRWNDGVAAVATTNARCEGHGCAWCRDAWVLRRGRVSIERGRWPRKPGRSSCGPTKHLGTRPSSAPSVRRPNISISSEAW